MPLTLDSNNTPLSFARGLSSNLPSGANVVDGRFYLTTDTERIYAGISNKLVELNKSIRIASSLTALTALRKNTDGVAIGDFYYIPANQGNGTNVQNGNILAVCTGFQTGDANVPVWTQVNPDTDNYIQSASYSVGAVANNTTTITQTGTLNDGSSTVALGSFSIHGSGVTVSINGSTINLDVPAGALYELDSAAHSGTIGGQSTSADIKLVKNGGQDANDPGTSINVRGDGIVTVSNDSNGIKISGTDYGVSTVTIAADSDNSNNGFKVTVGDSSSATASGSIDPTITIGDPSTTPIHFVSGNATLPIYTKTQTDDAISAAVTTATKNFDAMQYKGTVAITSAGGYSYPSGSDGAASHFKNGDTYKVSSVGKETIVDGITLKPGDLLIAQGTEGSDGYISGTVTWNAVPSGDEQTITFSASSSTGIASVSDGTSTAGYKVAQVANNPVEVSYSESNGVVTATVDHKTITSPTVTAGAAANDVTQTGQQSATFTAVTGATTDGYGHITGLTTQQFTVVDTHNVLTGLENEVTTSGNVTTIETTVSDDDGNTPSDSFSIGVSGNDNLKISSTNNDITLSLVWGTF